MSEAYELIAEGNKHYKKEKYDDAEQFYKKALRIALINLNVLYGERLYKFDDAVSMNRVLSKVDTSLEARTNYAESLLRIGKYADARAIASEAEKTSERQHEGNKSERDHLMIYYDTLNTLNGYKIINKFFIVCSYLLEGNKNEGCKALDDFFDSIKDGFKIKPEQWIFNGLVEYLDKKSGANGNVKEAIKYMIDLLTADLLTYKISKDDIRERVKTLVCK